MKTLVFIGLMILMESISLKSQENLTGGEFNFYIINNSGGSTVQIIMELTSTLCWDENHDISNLFNGGSHTTTLNNEWLEFYACWENPGPGYEDYVFGLGHYKFTGKVNGIVKDYTYIDYRTSDLPEHFNSKGEGDINLTFNISDGKFYYWNTQNLFSTSTSIWDEKWWIDDIKENLEPLEPENLSYTPYQDHPKLQWSPSSNPGDYVTHYEVHRAYDGQGWNRIATQSYTLLNYVDTDIYISQILDGVSYKIRSKNGGRVSDNFSNTIVVGGPNDFGKNQNTGNNGQNPIYNYNLSQNYPNPFNPSTTIEFYLKDNSSVTLKLFDILGREVAILVNELLNAGIHKFQFDGDGLESGVYFYEIRAGNFRDVKKLILTK